MEFCFILSIVYFTLILKAIHEVGMIISILLKETEAKRNFPTGHQQEGLTELVLSPGLLWARGFLVVHQ